MENHFIRTNSRGMVEVVDLETGEVVRREEEDGLVDYSSLVRFESPDGPIYLPKGIAPPGQRVKVWAFNRFFGEKICDQLMEEADMTLTQICRQTGFPPYYTVARWMMENRDFAESIRVAREMKAELHADRMIELAEDTDEDNSKSQKVKIDTHKWAAEKANPNRYGQKVQVISEKTVSITVNTGFSEVEQTIEAESREIITEEAESR